LILPGLETLPLRMDRICDNTLAVAQFLHSHPKVQWVDYAGLPGHVDHAVAQRLLGGRASADLVRTGERVTTVEAHLVESSGEVILRREITAQGRSRAFIDGVAVTSAALRERCSRVVELHGQHEHQRLLDPTTHLPLLDGVAGLTDLAIDVRRAWEVTGGQLPIYVTENGIGTDDDTQRIAYVDAALDGVLDCIDEGIDVRGYTYWSLLDNFEWAEGYTQRFGITYVNYSTLARTPKLSAKYYREVIARGAVM